MDCHLNAQADPCRNCVAFPKRTASLIEPFSEEYIKLLDYKKIPIEGMKKLPKTMNLIKVVPKSFDLLDSDLKKEGVDSRQHLDVDN